MDFMVYVVVISNECIIQAFGSIGFHDVTDIFDDQVGYNYSLHVQSIPMGSKNEEAVNRREVKNYIVYKSKAQRNL